MTSECDLIQDLLPMYAEKIASDSTCSMVEEHVKTCCRCKEMLHGMQQDIVLPTDTDTGMLEKMGVGFRKKSLLSVACVVLALLLLLHGALVLCTVPVWMSAEDAIVETVGVQPLTTMSTPRNQFVFVTAPEVVRLHQSGSAIWCEGYRISTTTAEPVAASILLNPNTEDSLFYRGYFAGEENTLLYGNAEKEIALMPREPGADTDQTLKYLFCTALIGGVLCLVIGLLFGKRLGKGVTWIGVLLLCVAASAYFVTSGCFALRQDPLEPHTLNAELLFRLVHILVGGLLMWILSICVWCRFASNKRTERGDMHAA